MISTTSCIFKWKPFHPKCNSCIVRQKCVQCQEERGGRVSAERRTEPHKLHGAEQTAAGKLKRQARGGETSRVKYFLTSNHYIAPKWTIASTTTQWRLARGRSTQWSSWDTGRASGTVTTGAHSFEPLFSWHMFFILALGKVINDHLIKSNLLLATFLIASKVSRSRTHVDEWYFESSADAIDGSFEILLSLDTKPKY